jgi:hypothetical protein
MGAEHGTEQCDMAAFAEMCKPAPEHALLKPFLGTFRATVKMWMGPGDPMVHTGTMVNTMELGGLFLMQDYKGDPNDGPFPSFAGKGFFGFNKHKKQFEGFWADSAASWMSMEAGQADASGKVWTMHSAMDDPMSGQPMTKRTVIRIADNNHHSMEMYFTPQGGEESKGMEITYVRK